MRPILLSAAFLLAAPAAAQTLLVGNEGEDALPASTTLRRGVQLARVPTGPKPARDRGIARTGGWRAVVSYGGHTMESWTSPAGSACG
ncbi:hypothetical protein AB5I41_07070 [Sphingomonas sp. MMS24-JH45]